MISLLFAVVVVFLLLLVNEMWWRKKKRHNEVNRKFVHITVGSFVAFWPYFLSWEQIIGLSAAFLVVVALSKHLGIFKAIHSVQRPTWGEVFFALSVGIIAFVTNNKEVYAVALLQMSLADGLAAIVGLRYGLRNRYHVFGAPKSVAGTATFFVISFALLAGFVAVADVSAPIAYLATLALATSLIENLGVYGLDNLFVPLVVAAALH